MMKNVIFIDETMSNPKDELLTLWVSSGNTTESCYKMRWQMVVVSVVV